MAPKNDDLSIGLKYMKFDVHEDFNECLTGGHIFVGILTVSWGVGVFFLKKVYLRPKSGQYFVLKLKLRNKSVLKRSEHRLISAGSPTLPGKRC